jgi:hypothetical protein
MLLMGACSKDSASASKPINSVWTTTDDDGNLKTLDFTGCDDGGTCQEIVTESGGVVTKELLKLDLQTSGDFVIMSCSSSCPGEAGNLHRNYSHRGSVLQVCTGAPIPTIAGRCEYYY